MLCASNLFHPIIIFLANYFFIPLSAIRVSFKFVFFFSILVTNIYEQRMINKQRNGEKTFFQSTKVLFCLKLLNAFGISNSKMYCKCDKISFSLRNFFFLVYLPFACFHVCVCYQVSSTPTDH